MNLGFVLPNFGLSILLLTMAWLAVRTRKNIDVISATFNAIVFCLWGIELLYTSIYFMFAPKSLQEISLEHLMNWLLFPIITHIPFLFILAFHFIYSIVRRRNKL